MRFRDIYVVVMAILRERDLLSAAGCLCRAADDLRAIGLLRLAEEIDSFIAMLDAEILLGTLADEQVTDGPSVEGPFRSA